MTRSATTRLAIGALAWIGAMAWAGPRAEAQFSGGALSTSGTALTAALHRGETSVGSGSISGAIYTGYSLGGYVGPASNYGGYAVHASPLPRFSRYYGLTGSAASFYAPSVGRPALSTPIDGLPRDWVGAGLPH